MKYPIEKAGAKAWADAVASSEAAGAALAAAVADASGFISVKRFGVLGTGVDQHAALQSAIASGEDLYFPPTDDYYGTEGSLTPIKAGQRLYGAGLGSQIRGLTSGVDVFSIGSSYPDCELNRLHIYCPAGGASLAGAGVLTVADRTKLTGLIVRQHETVGLYAKNANDCEIVGCSFFEARNDDDDTHLGGTTDVYIGYSSARALVQACRMLSGAGVGVAVQSVVSDDEDDDDLGDVASFTQILGNYIRMARQYGIMAYRNDQAVPIDQYVLQLLIQHNTIDTVTGTIVHSTDGDVYGAGIYLQGCEFVDCSHNQIYRSHFLNAATVISQLAPGAIGVTNCSAFTLKSNTIVEPGLDGIHISGGGETLMAERGISLVEGNHVYDFGRNGFRHIKRHNVRYKGNLAINITKTASPASDGFFIDDSASGTEYRGITLEYNHAEECVGSGFSIDKTTGLRAIGNTARHNSTNGMAISQSSQVTVEQNRATNNRVRNFQLASTVTSGKFASNKGEGTAIGSAFMNGSANANSSENFRLEGVVAIEDLESDGVGTNTIAAISFTAQDATPSVKGLRQCQTANASATTITALDDGIEGQTVEILINDANTTVDFSGTTLRGNAGVDWTPANGDMMICTRRGANWYCRIIDATA